MQELTKEQELEILLHKTLDALTQMTVTLIATIASQSVLKSAAQETPLVYTYTFTQTVSNIERVITMKFQLGNNGTLELLSTDVKDKNPA